MTKNGEASKTRFRDAQGKVGMIIMTIILCSFSRQGHVQEVQGLFPNLYRPHTDDLVVQRTFKWLSHVQDMPTVMHSLDPGFSLTRGLGREIPAYFRIAATTNGQGPSTLSLHSSNAPVLRSSPWPVYNQRQSYFSCRAGRSTRPHSFTSYCVTILTFTRCPYTRTVVDSLHENVLVVPFGKSCIIRV